MANQWISNGQTKQVLQYHFPNQSNHDYELPLFDLDFCWLGLVLNQMMPSCTAISPFTRSKRKPERQMEYRRDLKPWSVCFQKTKPKSKVKVIHRGTFLGAQRTHSSQWSTSKGNRHLHHQPAHMCCWFAAETCTNAMKANGGLLSRLSFTQKHNLIFLWKLKILFTVHWLSLKITVAKNAFVMAVTGS